MKRMIGFLIIAIPLFCKAQEMDKRGVILTSSPNNITGNTYAVVIGISNYKDVTRLKYADRDAKVFADYLLSKSGAALDSDKVKLFVNEKATLNNIGNALSDIMISNLKKGDRIVFFFAGHGDYDANILKDQALLLLYGAPKQNYFQNIFSGDFISTADLNSRFVEPLAAKGCEVMLIVDACHATGLNKNLAGGIEGGKITTMALQNMTSPVKLYSCQANEYSLESEQWGGGRGLFSYVLMEGLYGMADADNNKIVSLRELQRYLEDNVSSMAAPNKQNPIIKIEDATQAISKVDIAFLTSYKAKKNKDLIFIAKADTKGNKDNWLSEMDSVQRQLYRECDSLTDKMELDAAYQKFMFFAKTDSNSNASLQLRRNLSAALQQKTAAILNPMFEDVSIIKTNIKEVEQAEKDLEKAMILLGEKNFLYRNLQARILVLKAILIFKMKDSRRKKEAIDYLHQSIYLEPNAPYSYFFLGGFFNLESSSYLYDSAGVYHNFDSAVIYYDKYINLIPNSSFGHNNLGVVYERLEKYDEAMKCFKRAIELQPDYALFYKNLATIFMEIKNNDSAIINYKKAIELRTDSREMFIYMEAYNNLGGIYLDLGNKQEAINSYKKALEMDPKSGFANQNLGGIYYDLKNYTEALQCFSKVTKFYPGFAYGFVLVGRAYAGLKNYPEALKNYITSLNLKQIDALTHYNICCLYAEQKSIDSALVHLGQCLPNLKPADEEYVDLSIIATDTNLNNIRNNPRFKTILEKYFKKEELDKYPDIYLLKN